MSRQPRASPQVQYGFIETDDNPFDDPIAHAPPPQPRAPAGRPQQPRAGGGNAQQPRMSQAAPPPPQYAPAPTGGQMPRVQKTARQSAPAPASASAYAAAPAPVPAAAAAAPAGAPVATDEGVAASGGALASAKKGLTNFMSNLPSLPSFGASSAPAAAPEDDIATREANLRAREERMARMELEVEQRERAVKVKEGLKNNWPSRCYPILYHDIREQIPSRMQPMIRKFYALLLWMWLSLVWNVVTVVTVWGETGDGGTDPIWAVIWLLLGVPGAWHCWYMPVFQGAMNSSSRRYLMFFCGFFLHLAWTVIIGLGTPSMGAGGLMVMIKEYAKSYPVSGTFALVDTLLFGLNLLVSLYLLKVARDAWRTGGGSEALERDRKAMSLAGKIGLPV